MQVALCVARILYAAWWARQRWLKSKEGWLYRYASSRPHAFQMQVAKKDRIPAKSPMRVQVMPTRGQSKHILK